MAADRSRYKDLLHEDSTEDGDNNHGDYKFVTLEDVYGEDQLVDSKAKSTVKAAASEDEPLDDYLETGYDAEEEEYEQEDQDDEELIRRIAKKKSKVGRDDSKTSEEADFLIEKSSYKRLPPAELQDLDLQRHDRQERDLIEAEIRARRLIELENEEDQALKFKEDNYNGTQKLLREQPSPSKSKIDENPPIILQERLHQSRPEDIRTTDYPRSPKKAQKKFYLETNLDDESEQFRRSPSPTRKVYRHHSPQSRPQPRDRSPINYRDRQSEAEEEEIMIRQRRPDPPRQRAEKQEKPKLADNESIENLNQTVAKIKRACGACLTFIFGLTESVSFLKNFMADVTESVRLTIEEAGITNQGIKDTCLHFAYLVLTTYIYCIVGGLTYYITEGLYEKRQKCELQHVRYDVMEQIYEKKNLEFRDWKVAAKKQLKRLEEQIHCAHDQGLTTNMGDKIWTLEASMGFAVTVFTTIGYGHISPQTFVGKLFTIGYGLIGIPLLLMVLNDFGKIFTKFTKFLWVLSWRFYHTNSCIKIRTIIAALTSLIKQAITKPTEEEPVTVQYSESQGPPFEIDDEFNLPITSAMVLMSGYFLIGAVLYADWEEWSYFDSLYFIFVSMSTVGFGDFVPANLALSSLLSLTYLLFGLALTSMCLSVIQEHLTNVFKKTTVKITEWLCQVSANLSPRSVTLSPSEDTGYEE